MVRSKICTRCGFESYIGDDIQKAYEQGKSDAIDDFADYLKKNFRIGVNTIDEVVKNYKEQKNEEENI